MKKLLFLLLLLLTPACENTDLRLATEAGVEAVKAVALSDAEVRSLAREAARELDSRHRLAPAGSPQARRLARLTENYRQNGGQSFDFRVYLAPEVNAFALADGSIRFYRGLLEQMDDNELRFIIGHEMGHVLEQHLHRKLRLAYAGSALRKGIGSQESLLGALARSSLGAFAEQLVNSQFSQQEEMAADDYGLAFLRREGYDPAAAVSALRKLSSRAAAPSFLASHPAPELRAERLVSRLASPGKISEEEPTIATEAKDVLKKMRSWLAALPEKLWEIWSRERRSGST